MVFGGYEETVTGLRFHLSCKSSSYLASFIHVHIW